MKRVFYVTFLWIAAVLVIAGCTTTPESKPELTSELLVSNSNNFDYKSTDMNVFKLKAKPDWVGNVEKWSGRSDNKLYFIGSSEPSFRQISGDWTLVEAKKAAALSTQEQIGSYISNQVHLYYSREGEASHRLNEEEKNAENINYSQFESDERQYWENSISSSVSFSGLMLEPEGVFYELYEVRRDGPPYYVYHLWQIYSIPKEEIDKAREEVRINREILHDEDKRKSIIGDKEEKDFIKDSQVCENLIFSLDNIEIDYNDASSQRVSNSHRQQYNKLRDIYIRFEIFEILPKKDDEIGSNYKDLMARIRKTLNDKDPENIEVIKEQWRLQREKEERESRLSEIEKLKEENKELKDRHIEDLRNISNKYTIQSNTTIMFFPVKPAEVGAGNIFAANEMVSNRDFISFASMKGMNELFRSENGLDVPAVSVRWNDAALYCNWLSRLYGYAPYYTETNGQITGYENTNGYRLPSEAEIAAMRGIYPSIFDESLGIWISGGSERGRNFCRFNNGVIRVETSNVATSGIGFRVVRNVQ